ILDEPGKYRIRVTADSDTAKVRFSETYVYKLLPAVKEIPDADYIDMPDKNKEWMMKVLLNTITVRDLISNPYKYPEGYNGIDVYQREEIKSPYIPKEDLTEVSLALLENMSPDDLIDFVNEHKTLINEASPAMQNYINFLQQ